MECQLVQDFDGVVVPKKAEAAEEKGWITEFVTLVEEKVHLEHKDKEKNDAHVCDTSQTYL